MTRGGHDAEPLVTVGVPVFNGERFLRTALDAIVEQEFTDLEIVISDNASEDSTSRICREYAAGDPRIRYYRNDTNLGAARNHNRVVELARGKYFKWMAYDDYIAPDFLRRSVRMLEDDPDAVVCYSDVLAISEEGEPLQRHRTALGLDRVGDARRFHNLLWKQGRRVDPIYGLMRADCLRRTGLIRREMGSDRLLLAEMSLMGPFLLIPEPLMFLRETLSVRRGRDRTWWAPENRGRLPLRAWRLLFSHLIAVRRSRLPRLAKAWLSADVVATFAIRNGPVMLAELRHAVVETARRNFLATQEASKQ